MTLTEIRTRDVLVTGPTVEPLDLAEVKKHLRFTSTAEDTLIDAWISASRQLFEKMTGRQLITATWDLYMDTFPVGPVELPHPPLIGVDSVQYSDGAGSWSSFSEGTTPDVPFYEVIPSGGPHRALVFPLTGQSWPSVTASSGSVRIRYRAGYGPTPADVPELIKAGLYFLMGHFHTNREEVNALIGGQWTTVPLGASTLFKEFESLEQYIPRYLA